MSGNERSGVSRRDVLGSSLAMPLIAAAPAQGEPVTGPDAGGSPDPLLAVAATWLVKKKNLEAMIFDWQRLEKQLLKRAKPLRVSINEARGRNFPEAAAMRRLDRRMNISHCVLENLAREARYLQAISAEGALAKVMLGLRVQGRYGWQPYALELLESGAEELDTLLKR